MRSMFTAVFLVLAACGGASSRSTATTSSSCSGKACVDEGDRYFEGRMGTSKNTSKALALYSQACDARIAEGCAKAATMMVMGVGVTADVPKGFTLLVKACELDDSPSCNNVGAAWSEGNNGATRVDHVQARTFYEKACKLDNGLGCFNLGNVYRIGEGVPADTKRAFDHFKRACDLDEPKGCTELAIIYYEGTPPDLAMAKKLFDKGCRLGSQPACKNLEVINGQ